jgi:hypothetical protein
MGEAGAGTREIYLNRRTGPGLCLPFYPVSNIRQIYKERLGISTKTIIGYQAHADTAAKSNNLANKFVV